MKTTERKTSIKVDTQSTRQQEANNLKILFLEDSEFDFDLIRRELTKSSLIFTALLARDKKEFKEALASFNPDIILSDHSMPQFDSLAALEIVKEKHPHVPFILVTGSVSEEFAVACIKNGAEDYILKSNLTRLAASIENAMNKKDLMTENRIIKRLNEELKETYDIITQKNKDITNSIRYAEKIQKAILPNTLTFHKIFPESFILYRPKDIISGDFYWFTEQDDKFLFAVGDCTGHGVPGALLSMTGYHLLNDIVHLKHITDPSQVLSELNASIVSIFKSGSKKDSISDGMDIAFCCFDKKEGNIEFAGAKRPVFVLHKNEVTEIKGSSFSIGGVQHESLLYESTCIKLNKGDRVYLFTDGYADQFGGKSDKKINSRGLKELLQNTANFSMPTQKKFLNGYIEEWKQGYEQTDDILVMGIEI